MLRPARLTDGALISGFCLRHEERMVPLIDRIYDGTKKKSPMVKHLWLYLENDKVEGMVHTGSFGLVLPYFSTKARAREAALALYDPFMDLFAVVGPDQSALAFVETFGQSSTHWHYTQLELKAPSRVLGKGFSSFKLFSTKKIDNIVYREADIKDLDALMELEEAYQIEEVLTPNMKFVPESGRAILRRQIESHSLIIAQCHNLIVAKGGINARSFNYAQIGGVYTRPEWRSKGIATNLMNLIREAMLSQGFGMTLFVKTENHSALRVYARTGFTNDIPFSIAYYQE